MKRLFFIAGWIALCGHAFADTAPVCMTLDQFEKSFAGSIKPSAERLSIDNPNHSGCPTYEHFYRSGVIFYYARCKSKQGDTTVYVRFPGSSVSYDTPADYFMFWGYDSLKSENMLGGSRGEFFTNSGGLSFSITEYQATADASHFVLEHVTRATPSQCDGYWLDQK